MIDSKYSNSKIQQKITAFTEKFIVGRISANQITLLGLGLGLFSAFLIILHTLVPLTSGFQGFLQSLWDATLLEGFSGLKNDWMLNGGVFGWKWQSGDTVLLLAGLFMFFSFAADIFDGTVARLTKPTIFGGILDILSDRFVELILLIALISSDPQTLLWPGLLSFAAIVECITIFLLIGGAVNEQQLELWEEKKKLIFYAHGLMERTETFLFIFLMLCFSPLRPYLLWIFAILVWITAIQRFHHAYLLFGRKKDKNISSDGEIL